MESLDVVLKRSEVNFQVLIEYRHGISEAYGHSTLWRAIELSIAGVLLDGQNWSFEAKEEVSELKAELEGYVELASALRRLLVPYRRDLVSKLGLINEGLLALDDGLSTMVLKWRTALASALVAYQLIHHPEIQVQFPEFTPVPDMPVPEEPEED